MTDREKLILYRIISYGICFGGLILFAIGRSIFEGNSSFDLLGILLIVGSWVFHLITDRCPSCGRSFHRGPLPHYCPHCGEYIF